MKKKAIYIVLPVCLILILCACSENVVSGFDDITGLTTEQTFDDGQFNQDLETTSEIIDQAFDLSQFDDVKDGDIIEFGMYEQDNNEENGPEPIEWIVLHKAKGEMLVLSKYVLDEGKQGYFKSTFFYDFCFSQQEKQAIIEKEKAYSFNINGGVFEDTAYEKYTTFALSKNDVVKYLSMDERKAVLTEKAFSMIENTIYENDINWMLADDFVDFPGTVTLEDMCYQFAVDENGEFCGVYVVDAVDYSDHRIGIRPAIWLKTTPEAKYCDDEDYYELGDTVKFGSYWIDESYESTEPLHWSIIDRKDDYYLLVCDNVIDYGFFDSNDSNVSYENSELRKWLNETFFNYFFSEAEKDRINTTDFVVNGTEYGSYSTYSDKVFILSADEIDIYLYASDIAIYATPTPFAVMMGAETKENNSGVCYSSYWLRDSNNTNKKEGIRPAIWVDLD